MTKKKSGIALWNKHEQPRKRLLALGPHALADAELSSLSFNMDWMMC